MGWLMLCLALLTGIRTTWQQCDQPVLASRHISLLAGRGHRLTSLSSHLDDVKLSLEYNGNAGEEEDEWTVDIDYKTTNCLPSGGDTGWQLDEVDQALVSGEAQPSEGYTSHEGAGALKLHSRPLDWQYAQAVCHEEGGRLAVVDTQLKVSALQRLLVDNPDVLQSSVLGQQVLVGINDVRQEGVFLTSTGEAFMPWSEAVWLPNEPDDAGVGEDCVTFHVQGGIRDVPCYYELPFACERDEP